MQVSEGEKKKGCSVRKRGAENERIRNVSEWKEGTEKVNPRVVTRLLRRDKVLKEADWCCRMTGNKEQSKKRHGKK